MNNPQIKYYPVGNGDTSTITLQDKTTILIDCNIRESSKGSDEPEKFDVIKDLKKSLQKRGSDYFVDVFILSHGDEDHLRGYTTNFYQGDPKEYGEKNRKAEEIIMDEIWFSPMALETPTNDEEKKFKKEINRRLNLHKEKDKTRTDVGNRIKIIGYDGKEKLENLDHLRYVPGTIVNIFNEKEQTAFSVFIHAPFKETLKSADKDKNETSIIFQARFKQTKNDKEFSCLAFFGGDADHYAWELVVNKTKEKKKDETEKALSWDLFLAPHHCSWTYFNDNPPKDNPKPVDTSIELLKAYKRKNSKVIASCKEIIDNDDNPPSYKAKKEYVNIVTKDNFLNTETYKVEKKTPQPIIFEIIAQGPMKPKEPEGSAKNTGASTLGTVNNPSSYGSKVI